MNFYFRRVEPVLKTLYNIITRRPKEEHTSLIINPYYPADNVTALNDIFGQPAHNKEKDTYNGREY